MKKEDFLKLMDGIDDRLVEKYAISDEAEARQKQIRRQRRQRWLNQVTGCAVAAIILGVIGVAMLCASFGIVRMDRQSQKTPVSLGDGSDSQNNENNGDERFKNHNAAAITIAAAKVHAASTHQNVLFRWNRTRYPSKFRLRLVLSTVKLTTIRDVLLVFPFALLIPEIASWYSFVVSHLSD